MILDYIKRYWIVFDVIRWCAMVLHGIGKYSIVSHGIQW